MMARAAKRLGPAFQLNVTISLGDRHTGEAFVFGPAALWEEINTATKSFTTTTKTLNNHDPPPHLFQDSSFNRGPKSRITISTSRYDWSQMLPRKMAYQEVKNGSKNVTSFSVVTNA